jgi:hypothetical protein
MSASGGGTGSGADMMDTAGAVGFALIFVPRPGERTEFFRHRERFSRNVVTIPYIDVELLYLKNQTNLILHFPKRGLLHLHFVKLIKLVRSCDYY